MQVYAAVEFVRLHVDVRRTGGDMVAELELNPPRFLRRWRVAAE